MQEIAPNSPALHLRLVDFALLVQSPPSTAPEAALGLVRKELETLLPTSSITLENYNTQYLQKHSGSMDAALAAAKAQWAISGQKEGQGVSNMLLEGLKSADKPQLSVSLRSRS